jgi:hypothetical protein
MAVILERVKGLLEAEEPNYTAAHDSDQKLFLIWRRWFEVLISCWLRGPST